MTTVKLNPHEVYYWLPTCFVDPCVVSLQQPVQRDLFDTGSLGRHNLQRTLQSECQKASEYIMRMKPQLGLQNHSVRGSIRFALITWCHSFYCST